MVPQGYISQIQASQACANADKRLCTSDEFHMACEGASTDNWYPYGGQTHVAGYCNEGKREQCYLSIMAAIPRGGRMPLSTIPA